MPHHARGARTLRLTLHTASVATVSRSPRVLFADVPVHYIHRGNDRRPIFHDDGDRWRYRELLLEGALKYRCAIHAYVLMTNHVHLLLTPANVDGPARLTQWLGRRYVRAFNRRHRRTGTLWEGRYRSSVITSTRYLLACSRYIDLNPVRAGLCASAVDFAWSSYARLAHGRSDELVTEHAVYQGIGRTSEDRQWAYRALCASTSDGRELETIRRSVQRGDMLVDDASPHGSLPAGVERMRQLLRADLSIQRD